MRRLIGFIPRNRQKLLGRAARPTRPSNIICAREEGPADLVAPLPGPSEPNEFPARSSPPVRTTRHRLPARERSSAFGSARLGKARLGLADFYLLATTVRIGEEVRQRPFRSKSD